MQELASPPRIAAIAIALTVAGASGTARASAQDIYGYGTRGPAMAGATVALAKGFESVFYNPAGLAASALTSVSLGYQVAGFDLSLRSPGATGGVAAGLDQAANLDTAGGLTFGASLFLPLRGWLERRIALGFGFYVPNQVILRAQVPRPYAPRFVTLAGRTEVVAIQLAAAVRIFDWLLVGGGVRTLATLAGRIDVAPNAQGDLGSEVEDQLVTYFSEVVGVMVRPLPWLRFGVTYRGKFEARFHLPIKADLGKGLGTLVGIPELNIEGIAQYDPRAVIAAAAVQPVRGLWVELGVTWHQWSAYEQPLKNAVACKPCTPSPDRPWCKADAPRAHCLPELPDPKFHDTVGLQLGGEWTFPLARSLALSGIVRAGYRFDPSPAPLQRGLDNLFDSDHHVFGFGLGTRWQLNKGVALVVAGHFQAQLMPARVHHKSRSWPPPGVSKADYETLKLIGGGTDYRPYVESSGLILGGGGAASIEF